MEKIFRFLVKYSLFFFLVIIMPQFIFAENTQESQTKKDFYFEQYMSSLRKLSLDDAERALKEILLISPKDESAIKAVGKIRQLRKGGASEEEIADEFKKLYDEAKTKAKIAAAKADIMTNFKTGIDKYKMDNDMYPLTEEGLYALIEKSEYAPNWQGPYIDSDPIDPWGNEYVYDCPGIHNKDSYDLLSLGPDGVMSSDDITN